MTTPETFRPVLHRLLSSLVDPKAVRSVVVSWADKFNPEGKPCVLFSFNADVNEVGRITGAGGKKLRALRLLAQIAGSRNDERWWVEQPQDSPGVRKDRNWDQQDAPEYHDTTQAVELMADLLEQLGIAAEISVTGSVNEGFFFWLNPASLMDNMSLLDPHPAVFHTEQKNKQPTNLLSSIGILWHSIGAVACVSYQTDLLHRKR